MEKHRHDKMSSNKLAKKKTETNLQHYDAITKEYGKHNRSKVLWN